MKFGKFQGRIEDGRRVTGRGTYVDGLRLDAMVDAVCDALGVDHFEMPATPHRVSEALQSKGGN